MTHTTPTLPPADLDRLERIAAAIDLVDEFLAAVQDAPDENLRLTLDDLPELIENPGRRQRMARLIRRELAERTAQAEGEPA